MPLFGIRVLAGEESAGGAAAAAFQRGAGQAFGMASEAAKQREQRRQFDVGQPLREAQTRLAEQQADYFGKIQDANIRQTEARTDAILSNVAITEEAATEDLIAKKLENRFGAETYADRVRAFQADADLSEAQSFGAQVEAESRALALEQASSALGRMGWESQQLGLIAASRMQRLQAEEAEYFAPIERGIREQELGVRAEQLAQEALNLETEDQWMEWLGSDGAPIILQQLGPEMADALQGILDEGGDPKVVAGMIRSAIGNQILLRQANRVAQFDDVSAEMRGLTQHSLFDQSDISPALQTKYDEQVAAQDFAGAAVTATRISANIQRRIGRRQSHMTALSEMARIAGISKNSKDESEFDLDGTEAEKDILSFQNLDPQGLTDYEIRNRIRVFVSKHGTADEKRRYRMMTGEDPDKVDQPRGRQQGGGRKFTLGGASPRPDAGNQKLVPKEDQAAADEAFDSKP